MKALWKDSLTLRDNLQRRMPKLARRYFDKGDKALAEGTDWEEMHQFRLQTKRFRYTLETFRELYGPGIEKRIDSLKKVQTYLGDINDCIVTAKLLKSSKDSADVHGKLEAKAAKLTEKLRQYWADTFTPARARATWTQYLVTYACRPTSIPRSHRLAARK
ncbi:MAG TPA: CHAD domain-containing protein [Bryobacteraceae bacterium]|nr:CHAD domain-containing protein [Bryobacteraceae bacterium]